MSGWPMATLEDGRFINPNPEEEMKRRGVWLFGPAVAFSFLPVLHADEPRFFGTARE